ncbi:hypothetical protein SCLCIDRAFT_11054 [Scleroderma citrinum Foug A]|uniref:Uncharacterized protein n=1 Tax=Scleroderma citrinum Foug A TaxID=1036808 RepID=A0A0C2ZRK3_9AGAM|nr:hypothetical protein SCLCIDRAFT_11054 [Scleroderma citrinum Foug A]
MTPSMAITSLSDPPSSTLLTSSPAPTTAPAPSVTSHSDTWRIIGGVFGGIGGGILVAGAIALFRRRKRHQKILDLTEEPDPQSFDPLDDPSHPKMRPAHGQDGRNTTQNPTLPSSTPHVPNGHHASAEKVSGPNVIALFPDGQPAPSSVSPRADVPQSLTDEERMPADRHAGIREWQRGVALSRTNSFATTAPLSNDLNN